MKRLNASFFEDDVLLVAQELIGKWIVRCFENGEVKRYRITETEAYKGEEDLACHASKGRTPRTEIMYHQGGKVYVYLIYGKYWLLNFVSDKIDFPAAVLIRSVEGITGPGRLGQELQLNKSFYGESLSDSERIWVEDDKQEINISISKRIGVDYAGDWSERLWRFTIDME